MTRQFKMTMTTYKAIAITIIVTEYHLQENTSSSAITAKSKEKKKEEQKKKRSLKLISNYLIIRIIV